jgi:hypothetical protein
MTFSIKELLWAVAVIASVSWMVHSVSPITPKTYYVVVVDAKGEVDSDNACSEVVVQSPEGTDGYSVSYTGTFHVKRYLTHLRDVSVHPIVLAPEYQKECSQ